MSRVQFGGRDLTSRIVPLPGRGVFWNNSTRHDPSVDRSCRAFEVGRPDRGGRLLRGEARTLIRVRYRTP